MSSLSLNDSVARRSDFVLKLRIVGVGDAPQNQVRRVRLHRIQVDGEISYPALVDVAIKCTFPNAPLAPEEYDVGLTYYDIDNDCITIACTEELIDAIDQFAAIDRPVLKITTDVKRKEGLPPVAPAVSSRAVPSETPSSSERPAQLPQLIESFVSVLSRAIEALQKQVAEVNQARTEEASTPKKEEASTPKKEETAEELSKAVVNNIVMEDEKPKETPNGPPRPFIHGRHTCNGCLCTPIIGTRYHSTNLDDYDLCAKCKDSYQGEEIHFEVAELDRDRPFQERWHRKRERLNGRGSCRPNGRGQGRHRHGPCRGPHARRGPPFRWQQEGMDKAFEEAVRRSLLEVKSTEGPTKPEPADSKPKPAESKPEPSAPADVKQEDNTKPEPSAPSDDEQTLDIADVATPANEEETETDETEASTVDDIVKSEEDIVYKEKVTTTNEETADSSFSTDAVGHGDAAEKLGQTLDECAQVIDAMVSELDRAATVTAEAIDDEDSDDGFPAASVVETSSEKEAMIVDGEEDGEEENVVEDDSEKKSVASEEEWQVVTEDEQVASDEMIARAAQLIGSALFQSDLRSSEAGEATFSTLSESGNLGGDESVLSVPSSVPSMTSGLSPAVLDRWALQLTQLRELGFHDDAKNVDILERLGAAKVGVDDEDEVSVAQVVDALLNN